MDDHRRAIASEHARKSKHSPPLVDKQRQDEQEREQERQREAKQREIEAGKQRAREANALILKYHKGGLMDFKQIANLLNALGMLSEKGRPWYQELVRSTYNRLKKKSTKA